jgi:hypothetical protein
MVPCSKTKALSIFLLIILFFVPIAGAASNSASIREADIFKAPDNSATKNDLFTELSVKAELYNQNFDKVPIFLQRLVGSQQVGGKIKLDNGEMLYVTLIMRGGKVGEFYRYNTSTDPNSKFGPSIIVDTDEQTVRKILDSKDPLRETVTSMNEDSFKVKAEGFFLNAELWGFQQVFSS